MLVGWNLLAQKFSRRRSCFWLVLAMVLLNVYARVGVVLPRLYGSNWHEYLNFSSLISGVEAPYLVIANGVFVGGYAYILYAIWCRDKKAL